MGPGTSQNDPEYQRILGIDFFGGSAARAIEKMSGGGLLVVPAAPALKDLDTNAAYREALLNADLVITDSALMVLVWKIIRRRHLGRLSGLEYLRALLEVPEVRERGRTLWIMAGPESAKRNLAWHAEQGITVPEECVYMAPLYGDVIEDLKLVDLVESVRPRNVIVTIGGGTQERLGLYLKRQLSFVPGIHCIGAAIAFLSGDQVRIPVWADYTGLGWLFRSVSEPRRYVPRYWAARRLVTLMVRYGTELPPLRERVIL